MRQVLADLIAGRAARGASRRLLARIAAVLVLVALYPVSTALGGGTFEGVATCAGSTCHGRAEGNGA
ncbi:MAG: hypothetical protein C0472_11635, partial [Erythrobacter sp.]|nr:hypothetical protein [Erythrobacter sp.]